MKEVQHSNARWRAMRMMEKPNTQIILGQTVAIDPSASLSWEDHERGATLKCQVEGNENDGKAQRTNHFGTQTVARTQESHWKAVWGLGALGSVGLPQCQDQQKLNNIPCTRPRWNC